MPSETYLKVPFQSCDILTAHLHIIQSDLRQKEKSDWRLVMAVRTLSDSPLLSQDATGNL